MAGTVSLHMRPTAAMYMHLNLSSRVGNKTEVVMSVAFLFPGQRSQVPAMLHALPDHSSLAQTLDEVSEALGENVLELDSPEALRSTLSVQLELLASGVAVARALIAERVAGELLFHPRFLRIPRPATILRCAIS